MVPNRPAARQHIGLAEGEPDPRPDRVTERRRQFGRPAIGEGEQPEQRVLLQQPAVPADAGVRDGGERAQAFGQARGLRVDHAGGDIVPVPVAGLLAAGQTLPDLIAQPPVEFGQAGRDPRLALLRAPLRLLRVG